MLRVNLLPLKKTHTRLFLLISVIILGLVLSLQIYLTWRNIVFAGKIKLQGDIPPDLIRDIQGLKGRVDWQKNYEMLKKDCSELDGKIDLLQSDSANQIILLNKLADSLPENIWLTKIEANAKGKISIQGESINYEQVLQWVEDLKKNAGGFEVHLLDFQGQQVIQFSLECVQEVRV